jgi:hypothetical protein
MNGLDFINHDLIWFADYTMDDFDFMNSKGYPSF